MHATSYSAVKVAYSAGCFRDLSASQNEAAALPAGGPASFLVCNLVLCHESCCVESMFSHSSPRGAYVFETSCITGFSPPNNGQDFALDGSLVINFSEAGFLFVGTMLYFCRNFCVCSCV